MAGLGFPASKTGMFEKATKVLELNISIRGAGHNSFADIVMFSHNLVCISRLLKWIIYKDKTY